MLRCDPIFPNALPNRPWRELNKGKPADEYWLGRQLLPFGVRPQTVRINGQVAKGYLHEDFVEPARRYVAAAGLAGVQVEPSATGTTGGGRDLRAERVLDDFVEIGGVDDIRRSSDCA
jgi:hypothetical protein